MDSSILKRAEKFIKEKSRRRQWIAAVSALSVVVVVAMALILMAPARAMNGETFCGAENHVHSEKCYGRVLKCGYPDESEEGESSETTESTESSASGENEKSSETTDSTESSASEESEESSEAAGSTESSASGESAESSEAASEENSVAEAHVHDDSCYKEEKVQICELEEKPGHTHSEVCYVMPEEAVLICLNEDEDHEHAEICYGILNCELEESEEHTHTAESKCYIVAQKIPGCGLEEVEGAHTHGDDCFEIKKELVCSINEDEESIETASQEESAGTESSETASGTESESQQETESESAQETETESGETEESVAGQETDTDAHVHTDECYETVLLCKLEEHEHEDKCYEEPVLYCTDYLHVHEDDCLNEEGEVICGYADFVVHIHDEKVCFGSKGTQVCPLSEIEAHVHTKECYEQKEEGEGQKEGKKEVEQKEEGKQEESSLICEKEEIELHIHIKSCYDEEQNLICEKLEIKEHIHNEECLIKPEKKVKIVETSFEAENFIITASYEEDALPKDAVLKAEQITEETDAEHYAKRKAQYEEAAGEESAPMRALLKIGFYVDDEETEPEKPVTITIQMLDENGMEDGEPVTVIHFKGDEEVRKLDSSVAEKGRTTFEMESFSEIAIGYSVSQERKVNLSASFVYEDETVQIIFHVEGEAAPVEGESALPKDVKDIVSDDILPTVVTSLTETEEPNAKITDNETRADNNEGDVPPQQDGEPVADGEEQRDAFLEENNKVDLQLVDPVEKLQFQVELSGEDSEEYAAYVAFTESKADGSQQMKLQVMKYDLSYDGISLDLSECKVTAEITPTPTLLDMVKSEMGEAAENESPEEGEQQEIVLSALQLTDEVEVLDAVILSTAARNTESPTNEENDKTIIIEINGESIAIDVSGTPNPHFGVQYYAWLDRALLRTIVPSDFTSKPLNYLEVIDTSKASNGGKAPKLPENSTTPKTAYLELDSKETGGKVKTELKLTQIYSERTDFEYYKQPTIEYLNAAIVNTHYTLKEIWVLREGKESNSTKQDDWKVYAYSENLHLTNRNDDKVAEEGSNSGYVYISDGSVIRLVYDVTRTEDSFDAAFYDYDISSGNSINGLLDVRRAGINSTLPIGITSGAYAFGNQNCGTAYGHVKWNKNLLNAGNSKVGVYKGCTFGLVNGVKNSAEGKGKTVAFSSGVVGPEIFGTTELTGKTQYEGTLTFKRSGDTYTLYGAQGKESGSNIYAKELDSFRHPVCNGTTHTHIWTNGTNGTNGVAGFWPMDKIKNKDGNSGQCGATGKVYGIDETIDDGFNGTSSVKNGGSKVLPPSDDGIAHNNFFGLSYAVEFELVKDYEGPLEYFFFGDDDMWVFLDDKTLVCDIGGVHSSVGEYVNLWDYLEVNKSDTPEKHTLRFFYTERGASGSTCWMQFTLPSVSSITPETTQKNYGELRIEKEVKASNNGELVSYDTKDEFVFAIKLTDESGNNVRDDYAYMKYNQNGTTTSDLVLRDGSVFTLKSGEYLVINHLRAGTRYTIVEQKKVLVGEVKLENSDFIYDTDVTITDTDSDGVTGEPKLTEDTMTAEGTIPAGGESYVKYTNQIPAYQLPETGGSGTTLYTIAGAALASLYAGLMYRKKFRERRV